MSEQQDGEVAHLRCRQCESNPTMALIDGNECLVCHCTHVDGTLDPIHIHGFDTLHEEWFFVSTDGGGEQFGDAV